MARAIESGTRVTLLGRLQRDPTDPKAWAEFVEHYGRKIYGWCRGRGLQEADAEDVTQSVLLKLAEKMRDFHYDPSKSFRAWLKTLTHHAWYDFLSSRQRAGQGSGDSNVLEWLHIAEARDGLVQQLEAEFDRELLEEAQRRVQLRVETQTWEAFRLLTFEGLSGAEAAQRLGMKVATVFVARSRVQKLLQEEIQKLEMGA
ncbi:MAG: sigma-70 family RNA polymerase sigma factor [Gemmataceae bacterium]|nr:sigma-70 family RNA polymerase sigma factor [Gemmataceae bacterium]